MATEKDKLTNALMALTVGVVFLLSREYVGLLMGSIQAWLGDIFKSPHIPGAGVFELILKLILYLILAIVVLVLHGMLWILGVLNDIYVLPVFAALVAYATPWPFRLGFLNPKPYIVNGSRWLWNMFVLSTYGEYLRRGRGKNVVFIVLPCIGGLAILIGVWGLWSTSFRLSWSEIASSIDGLPSIMPRERTVYVSEGAGDLTNNQMTGLRIQRVILSREGTKLVFQWNRPAPERTQFSWNKRAGFSPQTYLVDDAGHHYSVIGSEDMELGRQYWLEPDKDRYGTLIFEPLREDAKSFDLHFHSLEYDRWWTVPDVKIR